MAEVLGYQTLLNKALPTGWDATRLAEWQFRDGVTYGELVNMVAMALAGFNAEMLRDWGWLTFVTEEIAMEYEDGGSVTPSPDITDVDDVDPTHGTTIGHMIDLRVYGEAIGGTRRYFRDARSAKIQASIATIVRKLRWRFEQKVLTRWFTNTEFTIGSAGYNVPFVRGTGGNVDFAPPAFDGEAFATSHDHYIGVDDDTLSHADVLNRLAETLQEHGHQPPYTAVVARADVALYLALGKWVEIVDPIIQTIDRGGATSGAQFYAAGAREFGQIGFFQSDYGLIEVRATARIPTTYAGMVKSYGSNTARNPLAIRVHPESGFGAMVRPETTPDDDYPLKKLNIEMEYDVGVGADRTNGAAARLVSGGAWTNPTVS
jgi:hypothetical protein